MWYKFARKKFKYSPISRNRKTSPFALEEQEDKPEELAPELAEELLPKPVEKPIAEPAPELVPQVSQEPEAEQAPLLIDYVEPPEVSVNKPSLLPPPKSPHDGCRCVRRIKRKLSGGYEWEIDSSMCPVCQQAAQEYNNMAMDAYGVNEPLSF